MRGGCLPLGVLGRHDTTTNMILWALYEARKRDDVWARLKEEAASVLGSDR